MTKLYMLQAFQHFFHHVNIQHTLRVQNANM